MEYHIENNYSNLRHVFTAEQFDALTRDTNKSKKILHPPTFYTKESIEISRLLVLRDILEDLHEDPLNRDLEKVSRRLRLVYDILATEEVGFEGRYLERSVEYGFLYPNKVGRIYSLRSSIPQLPKDLRYFLFQGNYKDFDLVNSHPTFLYEFVSMHTDLKLSSLEELVLNRQKVMDRVLAELGPKTNAKKSILIAFYSDTGYNTLSKSLKELHSELIVVRKALREYCHENNLFSTENMRDTRVQSFFGMTRESELLLDLRSFLIKKIGHTAADLHFIPFFDGAYVKHSDFETDKKLRTYVEDFNKLQKFSKFIEKPISYNKEDALVTEEDVTSYENLHKFTKNLSARAFNRLLKNLGVPLFSIPENLLLEILEESSKQEMSVEDNTSTLPAGFISKKHNEEIRRLSRAHKARFRQTLLAKTKGSLLKMEELLDKE